tara:strand:- start:19 stop:2121 length:2103 start_codon:yes stop_codon:yes gene_type:complete
MSKKRYAVGCTAPDDWKYIHEELKKDGSLEDNIPSDTIDVDDLKEHSDTRAVYLLTDEEAEDIAKHPKVLYVNLAQEDYSPPSDELAADQTFRYAQTVKHHRDYYQLPGTPDDTDLRRTGFQLYRHSQIDDPWPHTSTGDNTVLNNRVLHEGDGKDVDLIVCDEGCWFGHVEFQTNATGGGPDNYQSGNVLTRSGVSTTSGTCDLCDLVLEAPYYIDPDFFNASPSTRLETRWDGTTVPVESVARNWWRNNTTSYRSVGFTTFGRAFVSTSYTRAQCNGDNNQLAQNGSFHGTQCMGASAGRTQGWAFNSNKWNLNLYGGSGSGIEAGFDAQKLFHQMKPVNPKYGTKDPTVSSNSWGYRAVPQDEAYYYYRGDTSGVQYTSSVSRSPYSSSNTKPGFMRWVGYHGDNYRMKGQLFPGSMTQACDELVESGVIFVCAAGNSNQKQVSWDHPDFDNYWNTGAGVTVGRNNFYEFGLQTYPYVNRRGFPQHAGMTRSGVGGSEYTYPAINIGALDDNYGSHDGSYKEQKVNYSDMGNEIDCFSAADGIITAVNSTSGAERRDTYSNSSTYSSWVDGRFSGTSAACPVAAGMITTKMQYNRDWTWVDVRNWLKGRNQPVGVTTVGINTSPQFHHGQDTSTAGAGDISGGDWSDTNSLEGAHPAIIWDAPTGNEDGPDETPNAKTISGQGMKFTGGGLKIVYRS